MAQSPSLLDTLLCQEEELYNDYFTPTQTQSSYNDYSTPTRNTRFFTDQDLFWEDDELINLLAKQTENRLCNELAKNPLIAESRIEAIDWILNAVYYYSFSHITAVLAVNYLDRFLCSTELKREKPWMTQLVAVACLSLAAKVEETQVPLLLDLQVEESGYIFEAKTIQKMEILILSTLEWKMNPITPISFIDHCTRRFGFEYGFCREFLSRCQSLIVSLISDSRFMRYLPSVLAAVAMLHVMNTVEPCSLTEYQNLLLITLNIDKEQLDECLKLVSESKNSFLYKTNKRKLRSTVPGSPNGVIDVCFSFDSWAEVAEAPTSATSSVTSSPQPLSKKIRADNPGFSL